MYKLPFRERQPNRQNGHATSSDKQNGRRKIGQLTLPFRPLHVDENQPSTQPFEVPNQAFTFELPFRLAQYTPIRQPTTQHTLALHLELNKGSRAQEEARQQHPATPAPSRASGSRSATDIDNVTDAPTTTAPGSRMNVDYVEYVENANPTFTPGELWQVARSVRPDDPNEAPSGMPQVWRDLALRVAQTLSDDEKDASIKKWISNIGLDIGRSLTEVEIKDKTQNEEDFWEARGPQEDEAIWQRRKAMGRDAWEESERERIRRSDAEAAKRHLRPCLVRTESFEKWRSGIAAVIRKDNENRRKDIENRRRTWSATTSTPNQSQKKKKRKTRVSWAGNDGEMLTLDELMGRKGDGTPQSMQPILR